MVPPAQTSSIPAVPEAAPTPTAVAPAIVEPAIVEVQKPRPGKTREVTLLSGEKMKITPVTMKLTEAGLMPYEFTINGTQFKATGMIWGGGRDRSIHSYKTETGEGRYFAQLDRKPGTAPYIAAQEKGEARFPDLAEVPKPSEGIRLTP